MYFSKAIADLHFIRKCCWQVPDVDRTGALRGLGRGAEPLRGWLAPGWNCTAEAAGPEGCSLPAAQTARVPLCAPVLCSLLRGYHLAHPTPVSQLHSTPLCPAHRLPRAPSHLLRAAGWVPATPPPARERLARATRGGHRAQGCRQCCRWRGSCVPRGSQCEWPLARPPEGGYRQGVQVPVLPGLGAQVGSLPAS